MEETRKHDPAYHAQITIGSNYMPWENAQKCADIVKYAGYNYGEKYYDQHHREHPDWFMYGSETASTVQSRGVYHFPYKQSVLADIVT
jgi:beta-galactosidase